MSIDSKLHLLFVIFFFERYHVPKKVGRKGPRSQHTPKPQGTRTFRSLDFLVHKFQNRLRLNDVCLEARYTMSLYYNTEFVWYKSQYTQNTSEYTICSCSWMMCVWKLDIQCTMLLCYSQLQIGWHSISRLFLKLFERTRILEARYTISLCYNTQCVWYKSQYTHNTSEYTICTRQIWVHNLCDTNLNIQFVSYHTDRNTPTTHVNTQFVLDTSEYTRLRCHMSSVSHQETPMSIRTRHIWIHHNAMSLCSNTQFISQYHCVSVLNLRPSNPITLNTNLKTQFVMHMIHTNVL